MSKLQRFRHFRTETLEIVTITPSNFEKSAHILSDAMDLNEGEDELFLALALWSTGIISDHHSYFKVITSARDDDLAYCCIIRVVQSSIVSRLFTL